MPRGNSRPATIGELEFKTVTKAKQYVRSVIAKYPPGTRVTPVDVALFADLLEMHPDAKSKRGSGVAGFAIKTNPDYPNTVTVYVLRTDGTECDFSWYKSIDGAKQEDMQFNALREAVKNQVIQFKDKQLLSLEPLLCPITNQRITFDNYHVDHAAPRTFQQLVRDWLQSEGIVLEDVIITESRENEYGRKMADPKQLHSWREYHYKNARLRMLSKEGNLKLPKT